MPTAILPNDSLTELPKAWVTGSQGLIGAELLRSAAQFAARGISRETVDLLDATAVADLFRRERPALIIHCAAISRSPVCDTQPELARRSNVDVTRHLVELAAGIPFFFFSSDLVFDGKKGRYVEDDAPNPLSVYAETKAAAEEIVRLHPRHTIVRISLTGGKSKSGNRGFNEEMKNTWLAGKTLNLFTDEYRCPSSAPVIARAVWELATRQVHGTYHLCFAERLSRFEIGRLLAEKHPELNPRINPSSRKTYQGPPRPEDTSMNCTKVQKELSFVLPRFSDWLREDRFGF